jgi:hypothetical protein
LFVKGCEGRFEPRHRGRDGLFALCQGHPEARRAAVRCACREIARARIGRARQAHQSLHERSVIARQRAVVDRTGLVRRKPERLEKRHRVRDQDVAVLRPALAVVGQKIQGLTRRCFHRDEGAGHGLGVGTVQARQRQQHAVGDVRAQTSARDVILDRLGKVAEQIEPALNPAGRPREPCSHFPDPQALVLDELTDQPGLFERRGAPQREPDLHVDERVHDGSGQNLRAHEVSPQTPQRADADMSVDNREPVLGAGHDEDRVLLAVLLERGEHLALACGLA